MRAMFSNGRYANVTATLALVIALSGTSYAAITVTSKDIRNGTIRGIDVASDTITSKNVRNRTIGGADVANNTITSGKIRNGSLLARDFKRGELPAGATGPQGPRGGNGATNVVIRDAFTLGVPAGQEAGVNVPCGAGEKALSGGIYGPGFAVSMSEPQAPATGTPPVGWRVVATNTSSAANPLHAWAICAAP
ncbi:MAG: hypothetical protein M3N47_08460 [Chloroflexota bacterium]|nr:hypothetical protein [Chloroflexota bacterium]